MPMCLDVSSLVSSRGVIVGLDLSSVTNVSRKLRLVQNYRCCQFDENRFDARAARKVLASFLRFHPFSVSSMETRRNGEEKPSSIPEERKGQATKVCGSPENGAGRGEGRYSPGKLRFDPEASERSRANSHTWRRELGETTHRGAARVEYSLSIEILVIPSPLLKSSFHSFQSRPCYRSR